MAWSQAARDAAAVARKRGAKVKSKGGVDFRKRQIIMPRDPFKDKLRDILNGKTPLRGNMAAANQTLRQRIYEARTKQLREKLPPAGDSMRDPRFLAKAIKPKLHPAYKKFLSDRKTAKKIGSNKDFNRLMYGVED